MSFFSLPKTDQPTEWNSSRLHLISSRDQLCKHVENQTSTTYPPTIKASLIRHALKATNDSLCSRLVIIWLDIIFRSTFHPNNNNNSQSVSVLVSTHLPIKFSSFLAKFSDKWQAFPLSPSFLTCWWLEEEETEAEASKEWLLGGGTGFARWSPISKGKRSL